MRCELSASPLGAHLIEINFSFKVQESEGFWGATSLSRTGVPRGRLSNAAPLYGTPLAAPVILVARWGSPLVTKRMRTMNCLTPSSLRVVWMQTIASPSL